MAADKHAGHFFFHIQQLLGRILFHCGQLVIAAGGGILLRGIEEADLSVDVPAAVRIQLFQQGTRSGQHLPAVIPQVIQRPAFDQTLQGAAVQLGAVQPFAEINKGGIRAVLLAFFYELVQKALPQIFDGQEPIANMLAHHGKPASALVDVGRQHPDVQAAALSDIFRHLPGVVQHTGQQGRQVLPGVVIFQIGGLVRNRGIGRRMGFVKGIGGKALHLGENLQGNVLGNPAAHAALHQHLSLFIHQAMEENLLFLVHHLDFFLGHGAPHHIGPAQRITGQLAENLHNLLLIDNAPIGHLQDFFQPRVAVGHLFRMMAVFHIGGDELHGARPVQGDHGDQIFQGFGAQIHNHPLHAGGFKLENPLCCTACQHVIHRAVVKGDGFQQEIRFPLADILHGMIHHRQISQPQKIHFQKAQLFQCSHGVLGDHGFVIAAQRHIVRNRLVGDDHTGRVGRAVAGHPLDLPRHIQQLADLGIGFIPLPQRTAELEGVLQRHIQLHGNHFGHRIHRGIGNIQRPAHIPNGATGRHGAEGNDLSHMVTAVFLHHIVDHFLAALVAEINVKIRHADALGVEEPLEQQVVPDGINSRDPHAVRRQTAGAAAAPRPHRQLNTLGIADKIIHDQIVVDIPHLLDDAHLILQPAHYRFLRILPVMAVQSLVTQSLKVGEVVLSGGRIKAGQLRMAKIEFHLTAAGNLLRAVKGIRQLREQRAHLLLGLQIELIRSEFHGIRVIHRMVGLDAQKNLVHPAVLFFQVMTVVGHHQRDPRLPGETDQAAVHRLLLPQRVVLQLEEEVVLPENLPVAQGGLSGTVIIARRQAAGNFPRQTGRQGDQPLVILLQQLPVHPGLAVKSLGPGAGHHGDQVLVPRVVLAQQNQMAGVAVQFVHPVHTGAGCHIDFAPDHRMNPPFLGFFIKIHGAIHNAVVRDCHAVLSQFTHLVEQFSDAAGPIEQAVLGVHMQMGKAHGFSSSFPALSAISISRRRRWLTPLRVRDRRSPISRRLISGSSRRSCSTSRRSSGRVSGAIFRIRR